MTMDAVEASKVLILIGALDQYARAETTEAEADAWAMVLGRAGVRAADAEAAVADWFADPSNAGKRITLPAVIGKAKARMARRLQGTTEVPFPAGLTWPQEQRWRQVWLDQLVATDSNRLATLKADRALGVTRDAAPLVSRPMRLQELLPSPPPVVVTE